VIADRQRNAIPIWRMQRRSYVRQAPQMGVHPRKTTAIDNAETAAAAAVRYVDGHEGHRGGCAADSAIASGAREGPKPGVSFGSYRARVALSLVMRARIVWAIAGGLVWIAGCAQLLGLGDYSDAQDGGAIGPPDGGSKPADATVEPPVDSASGGPFDGSEVGPTADEPGDFDASSPNDEAQASDAPNATDATPTEAALDAGESSAPYDAALDAASEVAVGCPAACNSGCDAGACLITITNPTVAPVTCPPGFPCVVHCLGLNVCRSAISCASGQPCKVLCEGNPACTTETISQDDASSLCVDCYGGPGLRGCNFLTCSAANCSLHCNNCASTCLNCARVAACP
jgi:hypothetical protein